MLALNSTALQAATAENPLANVFSKVAADEPRNLRRDAVVGFTPGASSCTTSDAIAKNVQVSLSPSNPKPGDKYTLTASYDLGSYVISSDGKGKALYKASLSGFPVVDQSDDLCTDLNKGGSTPCPLTGVVSSTSTDTVPTNLPHGNLVSKIIYQTSGGQQIVCFEVDLSL